MVEEDVPSSEDDSTDEEAHLSSPRAAAGEALRGSIPSSLEDLSVLMSFRMHVAVSIQNGVVHLHFYYVFINRFSNKMY